MCVGDAPVAVRLRGPLRLEVHPVPPLVRVPGDGVLCVHGQGRRRDLKFNMAPILLPMCQNTITFVRNHIGVGRMVPFDNNISFHMVVAAGIGVSAGLHVVSHLTCDFPRMLCTTDAAYAPLAQYFGVPRPPNYRWLMKGTEGC
jgi:respiratory burst oxidase